MPAITPLQESFAAGEVSPRLYRRIDIGAFNEGSRSMVNFIASARGPAKSRKGFRYLGGVQPFPGVVIIVQTETIEVSTPLVDVQIT